MKLDGKVALITGAASGIGHGIAKRYLEADGRVVIADLNADGAISAARELADQKAAIGIGMDVTKEDEVNAGVEKTVDTFGSQTPPRLRGSGGSVERAGCGPDTSPDGYATIERCEAATGLALVL